jgi:protein TonB
MFDAVNPPRRSRSQQIVTFAMSIAAHTAIVGGLLILPLLYFNDQLPKPPDMLAFVVASAPPPPPPPPAPAAAPQKPQPVKPKAAPTPAPAPQPVTPSLAPVVAPSEITAPPLLPPVPAREIAGLEGGVIGGLPGGVVGGMPMAPPPPPPPPPPAPAKPVRVGGEIAEPRLVHRVQPEYPQIAIDAKKEGVVILEATVDANGAVQQVRVLRSEPLLDKAATDAVKQWRYAPLELNGTAHPFILTVTVSFNL